ncbi:hypothetical protein [Nonomuraea composti]|uniref:hypothetical protein n=1 Tax=Nonomuraea composti TaxID=2720023 RepID=UPI003D17937C
MCTPSDGSPGPADSPAGSPDARTAAAIPGLSRSRLNCSRPSAYRVPLACSMNQ